MVQRELYMTKIRNLIDLDIIKVITGIRRCGKSYLLNLIIDELIDRGISKDNIILINLDSIEYQNIEDAKELNDIVLDLTRNIEGKLYLFFDEIQNIKGWERSINGYKVDFDCDIYITGSNSNLLSGELATHLTGRYIEIKVYPFSFMEFIDFKNKNIEKQDLFSEYFNFGGIPVLFNLNEDSKRSYLSDLYDSIILKDVVSRYGIKDVNILQRIVKFIVENIGNFFSVKSICDYLKHEKINVSSKTIYNYVSYLENACFISRAQRENLKGKKLLKFNEKYYLTDHGFNQLLFSENNGNIGKIIENIVYNELLRRGYDITVGKINDLEIDFICRKANKKIYVQVCYLLNSEKTEEREFSPLLMVNDNYPKYVISMDNLDFSKKGIIHLNLIDFLTDSLII